MKTGQSDNFAYLLRLWRTSSEGFSEWQASLEEVDTGEMRRFSSLEELLAFIEIKTSSASDDDPVSIEK